MSEKDSTDLERDFPRAAGAAVRLAGGRPLDERLSAERWRHTLAVAETAGRIAAALGWPPAECQRALVAGLLHDVARELPRAEQRELAARAPLPPADAEGDPGPLLHARAGAALAAGEYGVRDAGILEAIATHPTGATGGSPLVQVLVVADFLEPGRPHLDEADRALLESLLAGDVPLIEAFCRVMRKKIRHLRARGLAVHAQSAAAWSAHCAGRG